MRLRRLLVGAQPRTGESGDPCCCACHASTSAESAECCMPCDVWTSLLEDRVSGGDALRTSGGSIESLAAEESLRPSSDEHLFLDRYHHFLGAPSPFCLGPPPSSPLAEKLASRVEKRKAPWEAGGGGVGTGSAVASGGTGIGSGNHLGSGSVIHSSSTSGRPLANNNRPPPYGQQQQQQQPLQQQQGLDHANFVNPLRPPSTPSAEAVAAAAACALPPLMQAAYAGGVAGIQINQLLHQTASLMAANAQLRKEIEQVRCGKPPHPESSSSLLLAAAAAAGGSAHPSIPSHQHIQQQQQHGFFLAPEAPPTPVPLIPFGAVNSARLPPSGRRSPLPDSYKTVMCQAWLESTTCSFGENCRFAHGEHELRPPSGPPRQNRKYKTKLCDKYTTTGLCPYGNRCLFIHPQANNGTPAANSAYIRPDKLAELNQKRVAADREKAEKDSNDKSGGREGTDRGASSTTSAVSVSAAARAALPKLAHAMPLFAPPPPPPHHMMQQQQQGGGGGEDYFSSTKAADIKSLITDHTPMRPRAALRPHPSWPLEPSGFFDNNNGSSNGPIAMMMLQHHHQTTVAPPYTGNQQPQQQQPLGPTTMLPSHTVAGQKMPGAIKSMVVTREATPPAPVLTRTKSPPSDLVEIYDTGVTSMCPTPPVPASFGSSAASGGGGGTTPSDGGYASGVDGSTPASGSGTTSPFTVDDEGGGVPVTLAAMAMASKPPSSSLSGVLSLPPISASGGLDAIDISSALADPFYDPFATLIGFDNIAREMAHCFDQ